MSEAAPQPYPIMLNVAGRLAVVVGGGPGAVRSAKSLVGHGADVVVIASVMPKELLAMEAEGQLTVEARDYTHGDLESAFLAIAASGIPEVDAEVAEEAGEWGMLVSVASDAAASEFIVPSVVRRGALQIAVTTGGGAPSVAREVRRGIAAAYGPEWAEYTRLMTELRILAIERAGLSDTDLAPLFAAVEESGLRARLSAGEKVTADALWEAHSGTVAGASGEGETG